MFTELQSSQYARVGPLFQPFDYSLSVQAALEGSSPGRFFADDVARPHTALALTVEGYFLAGDHTNPSTNQALRRLFKERIFSGEVFVNSDEYMSLGVYPEAWESELPALIPSHEVEKLSAYHYLCQAVQFDWRENVPAGYTIQRVDQVIMQRAGTLFTPALREWNDIERTWWSMEDFLSKGVSFCALHKGQVVTWCKPDCTAGDRIEVGIVTDPGHRRRGLAAAVVAATVEQCLRQGFQTVGWHCDSGNIASWKTAEKVGFEQDCEHAHYYYIYDPVDHLAELGWNYYKMGEYVKTTQYYERVFAQRERNPHYYYHLAAAAWAALENRQKALQYLEAAVEHGWRNAGVSRDMEEFALLHGDPQWERLLERMEE